MQRFGLILLTLLALTACQRTDPNSPVALRKVEFKHMLKSREAIHAMLNGDKPYDQAQLLKAAIDLNQASSRPWKYFPEFALDKNPKQATLDFHLAADHMQQESAALVAAVQAGQSEDRLRGAYKAAENACIRCHQQFRPG
jgi:cytochrome c556